MGPFKASVTGSLERNGRIRSIDVTARRYADGAYVACVRVPARGGSTLHTVEVSPREAATVRELMRDTTSQLRTALRAGSQRDTVGALDVVGHTYDVIGAIAPHAARPLVNASAFDIIGVDWAALRREAQTRTSGFNPLGSSGAAVGQGALAGLATGGVEGAVRGGANAIAGAVGLDLEGINQWVGGINDAREPQSIEAFQERRNRALRELAQVIAAGTHPVGSDNWAGALRYHVSNRGITLPEATALARDQGILARLPVETPYPSNVSQTTFAGPGAATMLAVLGYPAGLSVAEGASTGAAAAPAPLRVSARDALTRATSSEALLPALMPAILPGVASVQVAPTVAVPAQTAGAALGASELLSRALASLALERGSSSRELADAAAVASAALRSVDAIAGARAGDPRARAAIRAAVNQGADRTARALRIGAALVGQ